MKKVLQEIDSQKDEMIHLVEKWSNINSATENLIGLELMMKALKEAFFRLDASMEEISLPSRKKITADGKITETTLGKALIIRKRTELPKKVLLAGHMDIVFPGHINFPGCNHVTPDKLQGSGVADMKGGLVILLYALENFEKCSESKQVGWTVLITPDEEIGSPGSHDLYIQEAKNHQLGMIFEPSFQDGSLVSERKGSINFTAIARGKAAHVGRDFFSGKNALTAIAKFALDVESLTNKNQELTVNIGSIEGGGPLNIVPDIAICRFNVRIKSEINAFKKQVQELANKQSIELREDTSRSPKPFDEKTQKLFQAIKECATEIGIEVQWKGTGGVCDGNILAGAGLPTVDTLGIVGGNLHTQEEYALLNTLTERTKLSTLLLCKWAQEDLWKVTH